MRQADFDQLVTSIKQAGAIRRGVRKPSRSKTFLRHQHDLYGDRMTGFCLDILARHGRKSSAAGDHRITAWLHKRKRVPAGSVRAAFAFKPGGDVASPDVRFGDTIAILRSHVSLDQCVDGLALAIGAWVES